MAKGAAGAMQARREIGSDCSSLEFEYDSLLGCEEATPAPWQRGG